MKVRFFTRFNSNPQNIFVRIYQSKDLDQTTKTGLVVPKDAFSNTYQKVKGKANVKNKDAVNNKLEGLKAYLLDCYNDTVMNDSDFYKGWLKDRVNKHFNRVTSTDTYKKFLTKWAKHYNETETTNKETGLPLAKGTLKKYNTGLNCLLAFERHLGKPILLKSVNYDLYKEFVNYCLNVEGYTRNTTGVNVKTLKMWLNEANKRGFCKVDTSDFKAMTNETKDVYLTDTEINRIFNHNFSESLRLSNARDLLIVGVRTGLRVSDFMRLKTADIKEGFVEVKTQKTGKTVVIPMHAQIKAIMKRNGGKLPKSISDQKFNEYVKEVCEQAKINTQVEGGKQNPKTKRKEYKIYSKWELIASHTCRRSFASNLYGKIDNSVIMGITGHRTEKEFLKYIKITPKQHAQTLKTYWESLPEPAKDKTPLRKVN